MSYFLIERLETLLGEKCYFHIHIEYDMRLMILIAIINSGRLISRNRVWGCTGLYIL